MDDDIPRVRLTGERFANADGSDRQARIVQLAIDESLVLEREPGNVHDANAIRVLSAEGVQIGYVAREGARWLAVQLDGGAMVVAVVDDIVEQDDGAFGVVIRLAIEWSD